MGSNPTRPTNDMNHVTDLTVRIAKIEERNTRVELDKKWEGSWTRRLLLMLFTYLAIAFYFLAIDIARPFVNAAVPTIGFLLSTLTLPFFKKLWTKFQKEHC